MQVTWLDLQNLHYKLHDWTLLFLPEAWSLPKEYLYAPKLQHFHNVYTSAKVIKCEPLTIVKVMSDIVYNVLSIT